MLVIFFKEIVNLARTVSALEAGNIVKAAKYYKDFKSYHEKTEATISERLETARKTLNHQARIVDEMREELNE